MPDKSTTHQPNAVADQAEIFAFLSRPASYPGSPTSIETYETHGAIVFLAGADAYKVKRAVRFPYMDFSTRERRRLMVEAEIRINRRHAPELYLGATTITREPDGQLAFNGAGVPVEWCVHMRRFDQADLLSARVKQGNMPPSMAVTLADIVFRMHRNLDRRSVPDPSAGFARNIDDITQQFESSKDVFDALDSQSFRTISRLQLQNSRSCLAQRAAAGFIRRCHGDLHLNNIVVLKGMPTPFDAIEFNDDIAIIDTLYDLAFLLMDLDHRGQRALANIVFNRYFWRSDSLIDLNGLTALPLFLGLRSAIRAMVIAQRIAQSSSCGTGPMHGEARSYLQHALRYLTPEPSRLVAVGGFSGTGKSTLAAALAPLLGAAPGALHLRSDLERKAIYQVAETERLPATCYSTAAATQVYNRILDKARAALRAGHAVIIDAVFARPAERQATEELAREFGVPFRGLWLTAPRELLLQRVSARRGDASDATPEIVDAQFMYDLGSMTWSELDASGTPLEAVERAKDALAVGQ